MKVLLLTSAEPKNRRGLSMVEKRFPLGLGSLGAVLLEAGHEVVLHDRFLEGANSYPDPDDWDLVGIYSNSPCVEDTLRLIDYYKERGHRVAVGGPHASMFPHSLGKADVVCCGEGEHVILNILRGVLHGVVSTTRIKDLDALPMTAYQLFASNPGYTTDMLFGPGRYFNMNTSRGCPYNCTFCDVRSIWGRKYYQQSAARVLHDAAFLQEEYGIDGVYFREDNFTVDPQRVKDISAGLAPLGLKWACETRVDTIDQQLLNLMSAGGCLGLYIGIESGSQHMLDVYNKRITVDQIETALGACWDAGIQVMGSFITNHPEETLADAQATNDLIARHRTKALVKVNLNKWRSPDAFEKFIPQQ